MVFQKNKTKLLSVLAVLGLFAFCLAGTTKEMKNVQELKRQAEDGNKHYVAVIVKSTSSDFWKSVNAGANAAATEYNLTISFQGPISEEDYMTQNKMIEQAVKDNAEVIIFSAVDYNANAEVINNAAAMGTKIVIIDSDVNSSLVSCRIGTDNYKAGVMAGEAALQCNDQTMNIGIVNFDQNSANGQQREQGFLDTVERGRPKATMIDSIHVPSITESAKSGTMRMLEQHPEINVIATFNEWTSLGVGYAIEELGKSDDTTIIAFDNNVVSIGMLETGEVDALIVQNPYAMGYLGIENAYKLINDMPIDQKQVDTSTTLITRENMFDEDYQRVLFSVHQ